MLAGIKRVFKGNNERHMCVHMYVYQRSNASMPYEYDQIFMIMIALFTISDHNLPDTHTYITNLDFKITICTEILIKNACRGKYCTNLQLT